MRYRRKKRKRCPRTQNFDVTWERVFVMCDLWKHFSARGTLVHTHHMSRLKVRRVATHFSKKQHCGLYEQPFVRDGKVVCVRILMSDPCLFYKHYNQELSQRVRTCLEAFIIVNCT